MTERPVEGLIISLAIPTVISMLISALYNTADTYFVSQIGTSASAAVGVVFSLMAVIQAVGFTIGMGAGSNISRLLGEEKNDEANKIASSGLLLSLIFGVILAGVGTIFNKSLMYLLGASKTILPYAQAYAKYILYGAPVMMASFVLNNILRSQGKAKFSMIGISLGGILNIGLDPLFVFTLKMGIAGAAIATLISQCISFCLLIYYVLSNKTIVKISFGSISYKFKTYVNIITIGLPSFFRQALASISSVMLNRSAVLYGDSAVSGMTIVSKITMLIFSVALGIGQGYQPVVGYNYGAKKKERVKKSFLFTLKISMLIMFTFSLIAAVTAPFLLKAFIRDKEVIEIGTKALRLQCLTLILIPLNMVCNMTFQVIGDSFSAIFLSSTRQGIFFIPLIIILPSVLELFGVMLVQPISDFLSIAVCIPFVLRFFKKLKTN